MQKRKDEAQEEEREKLIKKLISDYRKESGRKNLWPNKCFIGCIDWKNRIIIGYRYKNRY